MKRIAMIPAMLTLGNGICGFASIAIASKITGHESAEETLAYFSYAGWLLIFAMLFDMLDGYVARLSRTASAFGGELDSLCDAISFGVAPAFLVLKLGPGWEPYAILHQLTAGIASLYLACTVLRLARFNVENSPDPEAHKRFRGLPSPGAAGVIAGLAILRGAFAHRLPQIVPTVNADAAQAWVQQFTMAAGPVAAFLVAMLMVSKIPYPHATKHFISGRKKLSTIVEVLLAALVLVLTRELAIVAIFWGYAFIFPLQLDRLFQRKSNPDISGMAADRTTNVRR